MRSAAEGLKRTHDLVGFSANASGVARDIASKRHHRPPAPLKVGIPLAAESPAPARTVTCFVCRSTSLKAAMSVMMWLLGKAARLWVIRLRQLASEKLRELGKGVGSWPARQARLSAADNLSGCRHCRSALLLHAFLLRPHRPSLRRAAIAADAETSLFNSLASPCSHRTRNPVSRQSEARRPSHPWPGSRSTRRAEALVTDLLPSNRISTARLPSILHLARQLAPERGLQAEEGLPEGSHPVAKRVMRKSTAADSNTRQQARLPQCSRLPATKGRLADKVREDLQTRLEDNKAGRASL